MFSYRLATIEDTGQLSQMRWDFRLEEAPGTTLHDKPTFVVACAEFLRLGLIN